MTYKYHLTFDLDWSPDSSIELCLNFLKKNNAKATFFTTHHTDMNKEILKNGHELGIHPNFFPDSSHGSNVNDIIEKCLEFSPNAKYMRTHSLYQSSKLLCHIFKSFPQLKVDMSIFMHKVKMVQRCKCRYNEISFDRILYNWEDDSEFVEMDFNNKSKIFFGPLTIYNFHPIHVHLNSRDGSEYQKLKESFSDKKLQRLTCKNIDFFNNSFKSGTRSFLELILSSNQKQIKLEEIN